MALNDRTNQAGVSVVVPHCSGQPTPSRWSEDASYSRGSRSPGPHGVRFPSAVHNKYGPFGACTGVRNTLPGQDPGATVGKNCARSRGHICRFPKAPRHAIVTRHEQLACQPCPSWLWVMGATDWRYLRASGIPCHGVQGFFMDRNDIRFYGRDERMALQSFYEGQAFLYELVKRLSSSAPGDSIGLKLWSRST